MLGNNKNIKAVYIQNFFRFGGSYFYNEFIKSKNTLGLYEPFHEDLSNPEKIKEGQKNFEKRKDAFNHPNLEFYFKNFPLDQNWFTEFHKKNVESNFFYIEKRNIVVFQKYLNDLIDFSHSKNCLPIFKINRLYFNPEVLEKSGVYKIFLYREPVSSFFSNITLNLLKPYYDRIFHLANNNIEPFKSLWGIVLDKKINHIRFLDSKIHFETQKDFDTHYSIFFFIWLYGLYKNFQSKFTFVNYSKLHEKDYSNKVSSEIFDQCAIEINFSKFKRVEKEIYKVKTSIDPSIKKIIQNLFDEKEINKILSNNFNIYL